MLNQFINMKTSIPQLSALLLSPVVGYWKEGDSFDNYTAAVHPRDMVNSVSNTVQAYFSIASVTTIYDLFDEHDLYTWTDNQIALQFLESAKRHDVVIIVGPQGRCTVQNHISETLALHGISTYKILDLLDINDVELEEQISAVTSAPITPHERWAMLQARVAHSLRRLIGLDEFKSQNNS
jgi:hypothetical protein